ncbi:MAG: hypothetical protein ACYTG0_15250 [Planctomycetota bacterium]|jgi:hypothetical protein
MIRRLPSGTAVAFVFLVFSCHEVSAAGFQIELRVQESAGVARSGEPISGGVPLPKGLFSSDQPFALFCDDGRQIACQVTPLVVETDDTLRWILLDFRDDVAAAATNRYVLRVVEPTVKPAAELRVRDDAEALRVATGAITLTVAKNRPFRLFEVSTAGKPVVTGGAVTYTQMQGRGGWDDAATWRPKKLEAGVPESVKVRYAGPLRVTLEVAGKFADDPLRAGYKAWITAWAGQSRVWLKYKLCNSHPEQYTAILVSRSALALQLASNGEQTLLGANEPIPAEGDAWLHQGLHLHHTYQDVAGAAKAGRGEHVTWTADGPGDRPAGWIAAGGANGVFVCDRLFSAGPARRLASKQGLLVLEGIAERFQGPRDVKFNRDRRIGQPWQSEGFWLYDCSHHSSEYLIDFAAPSNPSRLGALAKAAGNRLWVLAPGEHYSRCEVLGTGRFGTIDHEIASYKAWGWTFAESQLPDRSQPSPNAFVAREDNHYESEADSVQGLLLMYLRTGQRGWFDLAEAWARYHMDLQTWRTDGWRWKDGGIWFPSGGPQGNRPVRTPWSFNWGPNWGNRKDSPDCADLWTHSQSKSCYCHFYGSGLADYYCLTGDPDALAAAVDNVEQKDNEFRDFRQFKPGESAVASIRGFGRGFEVMMRVLEADPRNEYVRDLCHLCARTLWRSPLLDERGFHCSKIGGGWAGMPLKHLSPNIKKWMEENGIRFTTEGDTVDTLSKGGRSWPVHAMGGTWQHVYIQNGADLYARRFDDDDMRDFTIAFAQMSARYMLSPKCRQTWYYTYFDVPDLGMVFDPWAFDHTDTHHGEGCVHSGWYTRFYPDACAKGYSLTGERHLLEKAREFWYYGSKRTYHSKQLTGGENEVCRFAGHTPPKDDTVLEVSRLFYETSHPRDDVEPPAAVTDLEVHLLGEGRAEVRFTAPADDGGKMTRYQVKAAELAIVPYESFDYARDYGKKRNWWRAVNCRGEPAPSKPGTLERFVVTGVPSAKTLHFAVRSFDESENRSQIGNVAVAR